MGGGRGTRLYPLTKERCKPAVPLAGKYRLVDIPISNCLNSGYNQIFVLTQFNTASLHNHIQAAYQFDPFGGGFVDIMSAEQTAQGDAWYQGTADAVRQNMIHFHPRDEDLFLILSGDQLYRMDFREIILHHFEHDADVTISAKPVEKTEVSGLGVMRLDEDYSISEFAEKPTDPALVERFVMPASLKNEMHNPEADKDYCLASMGIYVFKGSILRECLAGAETDFGKEIIPGLLGKKRLNGFVFDAYWEDIGTVGAFWEANLALTDAVPPFNFYDGENPIYTRTRFLPAAKLNGARIEKTILADGAILSDCEIKRSVIGVRAKIDAGSKLENVVVMGGDWFETAQDLRENRGVQRPDIGIGKNCDIKNAIIDKNARIGDNVKLSPDGKKDMDEALDGALFVRDGIVVVTKSAVVPSGTVY